MVMSQEYLSLLQYARKTNGLLFNINHRYFNDSVPFGPMTNETYEWTYLTLDNVMTDSVELVEYAERKVPTAANSTAIVFGVPYGGFLSTMLRLNHPETFHGAIASGSLVRLDCSKFPNSVAQWIQSDWICVSNVYEDLSKEVADAINQSWPILHRMMAAGNTTDIKDGLNLCTTPSNATDFFLSNPCSPLDSNERLDSTVVLQLSHQQMSLSHYSIVSHSKNASSPLMPLKIYTSIGWLSANPTRPECYDWEAGGTAGVGSAGVARLPSTYITCTYFPMNCGSSHPVNIYPPSSREELNPEVSIAQCRPYGPTHLLTSSEIEKKYKYSQEGIAITTNIIFTLGQFDPISGYSVKGFMLAGDRTLPRRLYVSDMAHTQDLLSYNPLDSQSVLDLRNTTVQYIKAWSSSARY